MSDVVDAFIRACEWIWEPVREFLIDTGLWVVVWAWAVMACVAVLAGA